ncbi:MAG: GntR family transcriptional regulator, partial [Chloroflexota bacterium]
MELDLGRKRHVNLGAGKLFERTTVIDSIVAEIKAKIVSGELRDGDTLPSQDEMARELGVSR